MSRHLSDQKHALLALLILLVLLAAFYTALVRPAITQKGENQARIGKPFFRFNQFSAPGPR